MLDFSQNSLIIHPEKGDEEGRNKMKV